MATTATTSRMATIAALVFVLAFYGASAQSPAPETAMAPSPAGSDCMTALLNMSDCLTFVTEGSNLTKPDKACCPELAGLVDSKPICLCQLLGNPESTGLKIDLNKALKLPSVCGVTTPPVSTCSAVGVPVSLPPSPSPATSPSNGGAASSPGGLPSGPSPSSNEATGNPSGNNSKGASPLSFIFGLATVCVSIFF